LVVAVVAAAALTELAGVVALTLGASRRYDGPLGKSDRAFAFGLLALLLGLGVEPGGWSTVVLALLLALSLATVAQRVARGLAEVER
jgi:CDP-diacylglycerol--glycerol-3-phosphate 3-phosphatidyltransferase